MRKLIGLLLVLIGCVEGQTPDAKNLKYTPPYTGSAATTIASKLALTVNVKDFGATGNGSTNDSAAITAALTAGKGGTVYVPPGTYNMGTTSISLPTNTKLDCAPGYFGQGFSTGGAVFKFTSGFTGWGLVNPHFSINPGTLVNGEVSGCTLDLTASTSAQGGLQIRSISWSSFHDINILLPSTGSLTGVILDGQDIGIGNGTFWNDLRNVHVRGPAGTIVSTHNGFLFTNQANSNECHNCTAQFVTNPFMFDQGTNNVNVYGGGSDAFNGTCFNYGSNTNWNHVLGSRCEANGTQKSQSNSI